MSEEVEILNIRFNKTTLVEATNIAINCVKQEKKCYFTTPNPEILLEARKYEKFKKVINKSDLNIADGAGVLWAATYLKNIKNTKSKYKKVIKWLISWVQIPFFTKKFKNILPERVTGTDLMGTICKGAANNKIKIFLLGAGKKVAEIAKDNLELKYPGLNIVGTFSGSPDPKEENEIIKKINISNADILFVAFGAPKQEMWISRNLNKLKNINLAVGVGGAFDFHAHKRKRAPIWMQKLGLEWLYRLIQQPSRIKRIYNAVIKFPVVVLKDSF